MRRCMRWLGWSLLIALVSAGRARAEEGLLRLIPAEAEVVAVAPRPAKLWQFVEDHPAFHGIKRSEIVVGLYDNTKLRRLDQLIAYFEDKLAGKRSDLLHKLTGGGVAVGARLSSNPAVVVVVRAEDEKALANAVAHAVELVDQELERQESKDRLRRAEHKKVATVHFGKQAHLARVGAFLIFATEEPLLNKAIDLYHRGEAVPGESVLSRMPARKRGESVLVWSWLDFEGVQRSKEFKEGLKAATTDPFLQLIAGGFLDVLKRTPHVDFELAHEGAGLRLSIGMPRGVKGMSDLAQSFVASETRKLLPPLTPPRVVSSTTWTFDIGELWRNKKAWLGDQGEKDLSKLETDIKPFLGGMSLGDILECAGCNQRIVLAEASTSPYKIKPRVPVSPFAVVFDMKDERFAPIMEKILRIGGFAATIKFGMKMRDEEHNGHKIVTYYFDESRKLDDDPEGIRFNFSPSFTQVGKSYVMGSTVELTRDLVDCLVRESKASPSTGGASWRTDLFAEGAALTLGRVRQDLLAAVILDQGLPPVAAGKEIDGLIAFVRGLGDVRWEIRYGADDYLMEFRWRHGK